MNAILNGETISSQYQRELRLPFDLKVSRRRMMYYTGKCQYIELNELIAFSSMRGLI
ncbi:MAG: hypothetical protein KKG76_07050 [Euryarchaeota archaeon]|nr:hypothetical protein [Euryarchaeota archaeon]MBU4139425.1 hypothetical protein [Euryarchaeota archaeon]